MCRISGQPRWCCTRSAIAVRPIAGATRDVADTRRVVDLLLGWFGLDDADLEGAAVLVDGGFSGHADKPEHAGGHRLSTGRNLQLKACPTSPAA